MLQCIADHIFLHSSVPQNAARRIHSSNHPAIQWWMNNARTILLQYWTLCGLEDPTSLSNTSPCSYSFSFAVFYTLFYNFMLFVYILGLPFHYSDRWLQLSGELHILTLNPRSEQGVHSVELISAMHCLPM